MVVVVVVVFFIVFPPFIAEAREDQEYIQEWPSFISTEGCFSTMSMRTLPVGDSCRLKVKPTSPASSHHCSYYNIIFAQTNYDIPPIGGDEGMLIVPT